MKLKPLLTLISIGFRSNYVLIILIILVWGAVLVPVIAQENETIISPLLRVVPPGFVFHEPDDVSSFAALEALHTAEKDLAEMRNMGLVTTYAEDALREGKAAYDIQDYLTVFKMVQLIEYVKREKIDFLDRLKLLEIKRQAAEERGVQNLGKVYALMQEATRAFTLEQFEEANRLLGEAKKELARANLESTRLKVLDSLSKSVVVRYWWQSTIILLVMVYLGMRASHRVQKIILRRRITGLNKELTKTKEGIKKLQKGCFVDRVISVRMYKESVIKYQDRMVEINRTIPVLRAQLRDLQLQKGRRQEQRVAVMKTWISRRVGRQLARLAIVRRWLK